MHADEVEVDAEFVRRLLAARFPGWAGLPLRRVASAGTDNALFRLGDGLAVRLPRTGSAAGQVSKDLRWLPGLAPHLPLAIPAPLGEAGPGAGFPWSWGVYRWLDGAEAHLDGLADPVAAATELAGFLVALQGIDATGGPVAGDGNGGRGIPLAERDEPTRECVAALDGEVDVATVTAAWEDALAAPEWDGPPVWVHGDLAPGNLLARDGELTAVIDFACLGVGDPAVDLLVAWNLFTGESRAAFRAALGVDDATWARGRGWALSVAVIALPYYLHTNPVIVAASRRVIAEVLADLARTGG